MPKQTFGFEATFATVCVLLSTAAFAGESFNQGQITSNGSFDLKGKDGHFVSLEAGSAQISVLSAGLFGAGGFTIKTNGAEVQVVIPRKAYAKDTDFMAYAKDTGQKYNIRGTSTTDEQKALPITRQEDCTFNAKVFQVPVTVNPPAPCPCAGQDPNAPQQPTDANSQVVNIGICEWAAPSAGGLSTIKYSESGQCQGAHIEKYQSVTDTNHYKLEIFDPANPDTPVAVFDGTDSSNTQNVDLGSVTSCQ